MKDILSYLIYGIDKGVSFTIGNTTQPFMENVRLNVELSRIYLPLLELTCEVMEDEQITRETVMAGLLPILRDVQTSIAEHALVLPEA